jgi:hypothetical protein
MVGSGIVVVVFRGGGYIHLIGGKAREVSFIDYICLMA